MRFQYDDFEGDVDRQYIEEVMEEVERWLRSALKVTPLTSNLQLAFQCTSRAADGSCAAIADPICGDFDQIPFSFYADLDSHVGGAGIPDTDIVIFVSAKSSSLCDSGSIAYALTCQRD
eukprot:3698379-Rhodomonas_salina.1